MKLFKYPVLVFDNIIKQLDLIPLVYLSFCSRKTSKRIKRVSFAIEDAWFSNESVGEQVNAYQLYKERGYHFAVKFSSQQILYIIFQSAPTWFGGHPQKLKIGDTVYNCRYLIEGHAVYLGSIAYKKTSLFFNYILDLVRARISTIAVNLNKSNNTKRFLSEPCFKNVQKIELTGKIVESKKVTELYDCFEKPVLETRVTPHITSLSPTSKLLQSENLYIESSKFILIEHLLSFNGKYISLDTSSLLEEDIVAFMKHWLNGNYPNLEGVVITTPIELEYETEKVLNEFNTKPWNPEERAQNFIFKASYSRDEKNEYPKIDCSNGFDLERSDGLLATILFGERDDVFNFFVWHNRFP